MLAWMAMQANTRMEQEKMHPPPLMPADLAQSLRFRGQAKAECVMTVELAGTRLCGMRAPTMRAWRAMRANTRMQKERTLAPPALRAGLAHYPRVREPATEECVRPV